MNEIVPYAGCMICSCRGMSKCECIKQRDDTGERGAQLMSLPVHLSWLLPTKEKQHLCTANAILAVSHFCQILGMLWRLIAAVINRLVCRQCAGSFVYFQSSLNSSVF